MRPPRGESGRPLGLPRSEADAFALLVRFVIVVAVIVAVVLVLQALL